jgi:RNA polymerase sigma factor (sigma-70 family)
MSQYDESEVIISSKKGNQKAFAVLVGQYKNLVFTLALRMLRNREEAEEVAQDIFIKVFHSIHQFKGDSKFSTWLYRVVYNTCLDRIKKLKREPRTEVINEFTESQVLDMDSALDQIELKERKTLIAECLDVLPEDESVIMVLYYLEELSLQEISEIVNLNTNHLKIKLFRARKKMATILKEKLHLEIKTYHGNE